MTTANISDASVLTTTKGRTFCGLSHHHPTSVTVAPAFLTNYRLARGDPDAVRPLTAAA